MNTIGRNLLALGLLAVAGAGVGGYAYWKAGQGDGKPRSAVLKPLFPSLPERLEAVEMERAGNLVVVRKGEDGWRLEKPVAMSAEASAVEGVAIKVSKLQAQKIFGEDGAPPPPSDGLSGLAAPVEKVRVLFAGDKPMTVSVELGNDSGFDKSTYARVAVDNGAPRIVQLPPGSRSDLVKQWTDVVDRRALGVDPNEVKKLRVQPGTVGPDRVTWTVERLSASPVSKQRFKIVEPFAGDADDAAVQKTFEHLASAPVSRFVSEEKGADLSPWGLDRPLFVVTATTQKGDKPPVDRVLRVAAGTAPGTLLITRDDQPWVGEVNDVLDDGLAQTEGSLRSKDLFTFDRDAVHRVEIQHKSGRIVIERAADRAADWRMLSPEPGTVKAYVANGLVFTFTEMRGTKREAEGEQLTDPAVLKRTGLDAPAATIAFLDDKGQKLGALKVGAVVGDEAFVWPEGGPFIARVPKTRVDELPQAAADLLKK